MTEKEKGIFLSVCLLVCLLFVCEGGQKMLGQVPLPPSSPPGQEVSRFSDLKIKDDWGVELNAHCTVLKVNC